MDQELLNETVKNLTAGDDHGLLSVEEMDDSVSVTFDTDSVEEVDGLVSLPESAVFRLFPIEGGSVSGSDTPYASLEFETSSESDYLNMTGGVTTSEDDLYVFVNDELRSSAASSFPNIEQVKIALSELKRARSDEPAVTMGNAVPESRTEILVLANSNSLIEATELRHLIERARGPLFRTLVSQRSEQKSVAVLNYVAAMFLKRSTESVLNSSEIELTVSEACHDLGVDKEVVDRVLQRHNERTGENAAQLFTKIWREADGINFDRITDDPSNQVPPGYDSESDTDESPSPSEEQQSQGANDDGELATRVEQLEEEFETLRQSSVESRAELSTELQALTDDLDERAQNLRSQVDSIEKRIEGTSEELHSLIDDLDEKLETTDEQLQSQIDELRAESQTGRADVQEQVDDLQTALSQLGVPDHPTDSRPVTHTEPQEDHLGVPWDPPAALDDPDTLDIEDAGLHFPDSLSGTENLAERIHAALVGGRHLVLTGPPGSGKTTLAEAICDHYAPDHRLTTATTDWRTFDTVGGYRQRDDGTLAFSPGVFLRCWGDPDPDAAAGEGDDGSGDDEGEGEVEDETTDEDTTPDTAGRNEWLVVDELNRADADQAFGSLFTVLTGETVDLPFDTPGQEAVTVVGDPGDYDGAEVAHDGETVPEARRSHYFVPSSWRMVATANSTDKATLYRLSYAFMRRFAFVHVPAPGTETLTDDGGDPDPDVVKKYLDHWVDGWETDFETAAERILYHVSEDHSVEVDGVGEITADTGKDELSDDLRNNVAADLAEIWVAASRGSREIGPGIVSDLAEQALVRLAETGDRTYDQAVAGTLLPQFENRRSDLAGFFDAVDGVPGFDGDDGENGGSATKVLAEEYLGADLDAALDGDGGD